MPAKKPKTARLDLEKSLAELENIVETMEAGELTLEQAMRHFERGVALTKHCQAALNRAEQKVQILLQDEGGERLAEFAGGEDGAASADNEADNEAGPA